ncbi:MAG TPA: hypothetical protein VKT75_07190 [Acidobacteriaceae bacterium]|nr:hypothetical protein [Acidobacteriaceae bacterium]
MKTAPLLSFLALALSAVQHATAQVPEERPAIEGFVTRVASSSDFDVNTIRIVCGETTMSGWSNSDTTFSGCPKVAPKLGEYLTVFGVLRKQQNLLQASKILEHPIKYGEVSGEGVVDAPPIRNAPGSPPGTIIVRADGYWILIPFKANITFSIQSVDAVNANTWIKYQGEMRPDGIVVANSIRLDPNITTPHEEKFREKSEYDPASASATPSQSRLSVALTGVNLNRVKPWPDAAMQDRVTNIGNSLIPEYQKELSDSDPAKLTFRFIVVDAKWGIFPVSLPDGAVLVPYKCVERMQNDAQLAALLADAVATVLEKQKLRTRMAKRALETSQFAAYAAQFALGGPAGFAAFAGGEALGVDQRTIARREMHQSERVSLMLMHDAGYDITQAPLAWWLLSSGKKPISEAWPPEQSAELYRTLATVWSQPQPAQPPSH